MRLTKDASTTKRWIGGDRVERIPAAIPTNWADGTVCYHVYMTIRRRVGVRAMRQNLSVYLRRAGAGETFEVTTRGRPVAVLAPFETAATPMERLEASGRATPAEGDLLELGPPPKLRRKSISRALQEQRGERL